MATKSTKTSVVTESQARVTALQESVAALRAELETLRGEHAALEETYRRGEPVDIDRFGELTETLIPRREERLALLEGETLPEAKRAAERAVLLELAERDADGIPGRWAKHQETVAAAEAKVAEALQDIRDSVEEWNNFITPVGRHAVDAGISENALDAGDHPIRYVGQSHDSRTGTATVVFGGERYKRVGADRAVAQAVVNGDRYVAGLVRESEDSRLVAEGQRIQRVDRGHW